MAPRFARTALLLLTLTAAGCNATGASPILPAVSPTPTTAATPAPAVSTPDALRGTWTADVQGTTASSGLWVMEISKSDITLQNPRGGDAFSMGPISVSETAMELIADAGCPDQSEVTTGLYTLSLDGDTLTISLVSDSCGDRSAIFGASAWTRMP